MTRSPLDVYQRTTETQWTPPEATSDLPAAKKRIDVTGPLRILISKHATPIIMFLAIYYTVWQASITAVSSLFATHYGLSELQIGLTYIGNGAGCMIGTLITGKLLDTNYRKVNAAHESKSSGPSQDVEMSANETSDTDKESSFPIEKARLRLLPIFSITQCLSILLSGWTIQYPRHVHIAVSIISSFITGWTTVSMGSIVMTYLVDIFPDRIAVASAGLNLARYSLAAGGTSLIMPMMNSIGVGLAFTVGAIVQAVAIVGLVVQWRLAARWRSSEEVGGRVENDQTRKV